MLIIDDTTAAKDFVQIYLLLSTYFVRYPACSLTNEQVVRDMPAKETAHPSHAREIIYNLSYFLYTIKARLLQVICINKETKIRGKAVANQEFTVPQMNSIAWTLITDLLNRGEPWPSVHWKLCSMHVATTLQATTRTPTASAASLCGLGLIGDSGVVRNRSGVVAATSTATAGPYGRAGHWVLLEAAIDAEVEGRVILLVRTRELDRWTGNTAATASDFDLSAARRR